MTTARLRDEKIVHAIAFFAHRGLTGLTKMKVAKLLYFADKVHLRRHGRLLTGDAYYCMDHGPVPSAALNLMNGALGKSGEQDWERSGPLFFKVLEVERSDRGGRHEVFRARTAPDLDVFSESDVEVLEEIAARYGPLSASELRELSHQEPDYVAAERLRGRAKRQPMPVETFLMGLPEDESREILARLEVEDEDRRFVASL